MAGDCDYCRDWSLAHPDAAPRTACGPCEICQAPGHLKAHPRQPTSRCLCEKHRAALNAGGFRFELYHLIYGLILGIVAIQAYSFVTRFLAT